jgi:hypothetical protein
MKFIKKYQIFESEYFEEITSSKFYGEIDSSENFVNFTKSELQKILSFLQSFKNIDFEIFDGVRIYKNGKAVSQIPGWTKTANELTLTISNTASVHLYFSCKKADDEWYFICSHKTSKFYKCDQIEGLFDFLKCQISDNLGSV